MKNVLRLTFISALALAMGIGQVVAKPHSSRSGAWLGVYTQSVDDEIAEGFKLATNSGAIINQVVEDSPADEAGLRENDIVIAIDGRRVETADDLTDMIRDHEAGDKVSIKVMRDGAEKEFQVTLDDRREESDPTVWAFKAPRAPKAPNIQFFGDNSPRLYIGVAMTSLSDQLRKYFGVAEDEGILVSSVEEGSPAEKAGIKAGDVIVKADDDNISDASDLRAVVTDKEKGEKVEISLVRDRKPMTLSVEVDENEHASSWHGNSRTFVLPDIGRVPTPNFPKMRGLWHGTDDNDKDAQDLRDEVKELRLQLEEMRRQLDELRNSRK
jgi:serine protease Do